MEHIKNYLGSFTLKSRLWNIPFLISCLSAGFMLFSTMHNFPGFLTFLFLVLGLCLVFPFDPQVIRRKGSFSFFLAAVILAGFLSAFFYPIALESRRIGSLVAFLQAILPLTAERITLLAAILLGGASVYALLLLICLEEERLGFLDALGDLKGRLSANPSILRSYLILCAVNWISISALVRANVDYMDDMQRIVDGIPGFELFSRHFMGFLIKLVNTGDYLVDLSPLTQFLAVLIVSAAGMILILTFSQKEQVSLWSVVAVLPVGLCPYFLECLSFKFDCPYMALTIFLNLFPLLFFSRKPGLYITVTAVCILLASSIYQASLGIFPSTVVLLAFVLWHRENTFQKPVRVALYSAAGYLIGVALYRVFIMKPVSDYVSSEMFPLSQLPAGVLSNLRQYFQLVLSDFDWKWIAAIGILLVSFVVLHVRQAKTKKLLTGLLAAAALTLALCLSFGLYIALTTPSFACRAMYGFGVCIAVIALLCVDFDRAQIPKLACLCLSWFMIVFSFMYGNALEEQVRYRNFRMEMVLQELNDLSVLDSQEPTNIQVTGSIGFSPILENMPQFSGALGRMVTMTFQQDHSTWNDYAFYYYYGLENVVTVWDLEEKNLPLVHDGYYQTIYADENNILIHLKERGSDALK